MWRGVAGHSLASIACVLIVGCERGTPRPPTPPPEAARSASISAPSDGFDTVRVDRERAGGGMTVHTAASVADDTTARIMLQFRGAALPSYYVGYTVAPVQQCGSGAPVNVAGTALLHIRLTPTDAHEFVGEAVITTIADRRRLLTGPLVRELTMICDFEGQVEWVVGLTTKAAFRVLEDGAAGTLVVELER